jgi:DNA (cytosine-5)-methyltransferase 1
MKKILDLYCGAGGTGAGIMQAGFHVTGVDIEQQDSYPGLFIHKDILDLELDFVKSFDAIWASPPCQSYSWSSAGRRNEGYQYSDLVVETRWLLEDSGLPYIIENVMGAPLLNPVRLCGTMFPELKVFRHRIFESNKELKVEMKCNHKGCKAKERRPDNGNFFTVAGHHVGTFAEWSDAMQCFHMKNKAELAQSIPPAYSKFLIGQIIGDKE